MKYADLQLLVTSDNRELIPAEKLKLQQTENWWELQEFYVSASYEPQQGDPTPFEVNIIVSSSNNEPQLIGAPSLLQHNGQPGRLAAKINSLRLRNPVEEVEVEISDRNNSKTTKKILVQKFSITQKQVLV